MIRIVVRVAYMGHVVHAGAPSASVEFKTFDVDLPEVERFLRGEPKESYVARDVMGIELLSPPKGDATGRPDYGGECGGLHKKVRVP